MTAFDVIAKRVSSERVAQDILDALARSRFVIIQAPQPIETPSPWQDKPRRVSDFEIVWDLAK